MERSDAQSTVDNFTGVTDQGFKYVLHDDAKRLLGDERFGRMTRDAIRCLGPVPETVYPWNVVDYLHQPELNAGK